jgi:hypothetical protein
MALGIERFLLKLLLATAWSFAASAALAGPAGAPGVGSPGLGTPQTPSGGGSPPPQNLPMIIDKGLPTPLTPKQRRDLMKDRFENMKKHADELADLAKSLQEDLSKSNENVLSLKLVEKAEKIEKLARKIKDEARW